MATDQAQQLRAIHHELIKDTQGWALGQYFSPEHARQLRRQAILANHAYYLENIPVYHRFAQEEGIEFLEDIEPIKRQLMFPDDLFKSYDQRRLDEGDFTQMNTWLSEIYHRRVNVDVTGICSIDEWIDHLAKAGIRILCSSGTSGHFSFVPRSAANWSLFRTANTCYIAPLLVSRKLGTPLQQLLIGLASRLMSPEMFVRASQRVRVSDYDAIFLDFARGWTGNQALEQALAPLFHKHHFLYQADLSPSVLRLATRGPKTDEDREQLSALQEVVVGQKKQNYCRVIGHMRQSTAERRKTFIFGTPYQ